MAAATTTEKAIEEFRGYLAEVKTCSPERRKQIWREAEVCDQLMNYSPDNCWDRQDFRELERLVYQVFVAIGKLWPEPSPITPEAKAEQTEE